MTGRRLWRARFWAQTLAFAAAALPLASFFISPGPRAPKLLVALLLAVSAFRPAGGWLATAALAPLGALAAAGLGRHLSIDLAAALLPRRFAGWIGRATSLFAAVVCIMLAWAAGRYVGFQRELDMGAVLGCPLWKHYLVLPAAFWLMALRFAVRVAVPHAWLVPEEVEEGLGEGRTAP